MGCAPCPDIEGYFFDINGLVIYNLERNSSNSAYGIEEGSTLKFEDHLFSISYSATYYSENSIGSFNMISSAFATSCDYDGQGGTKELLDTMIVKTNFDIDDDHLTGQPINDILRFNGIILTNYLEQDTIEILDQEFTLALTKKPTLDNSLSIDVFLRLKNGEEYKATSETVFIE